MAEPSGGGAGPGAPGDPPGKDRRPGEIPGGAGSDPGAVEDPAARRRRKRTGEIRTGSGTGRHRTAAVGSGTGRHRTTGADDAAMRKDESKPRSRRTAQLRARMTGELRGIAEARQRQAEPPILEVYDLQTYFYTQDGVVKAVDGVSFTLRRGMTLGLVGESGCGKSVTNLSILGLVPYPPGRVVGGRVVFGGEDLLKKNANEMRAVQGRQISMIFQDPMTSLNPYMRVSRQITEVLELHLGMGKHAAFDRALELLNQVGIPDAAQRVSDYPHQFSGGMRQRVMIAMALACRPSVLLADEPTTALDVTIQAQILALIKKMQQELGTAVILVTHDLGVVAGMADEVAVMYAGRIVEHGSVRDVYKHPVHPYTQALLASVPRLDRRGRLAPIAGSPPDMMSLDASCSFRPRCPVANGRCLAYPDTFEVRHEATGSGHREAVQVVPHRVACWLTGDEPVAEPTPGPGS